MAAPKADDASRKETILGDEEGKIMEQMDDTTRTKKVLNGTKP